MNAGSSIPAAQALAPTTQIESASGRLTNGHFLLFADHLRLECLAGTFDLVTAWATGNVMVTMQSTDGSQDYVLRGSGATYYPDRSVLIVQESTVMVSLQGNGAQREIELPTDGSFFQERLVPTWRKLPTAAVPSQNAA